MKMKRASLLFTLAVLAIAACAPKGQPQTKPVRAKDFSGLLFSFYVYGPQGDSIHVEKVPERLAARITPDQGQAVELPCQSTGELMVYADAAHTLYLGLHSAELKTKHGSYTQTEEPNLNDATNALGEKLKMEFGMLDNRARMVWKGDTIHLCQDLGQASGIRYHGGAYAFTSWHGITELRKGGKLIFVERKEEE